MADNKEYYYLKFKDNFYDREEMIILENMENGYLYSNILLKMYLRSLKNEGKLMFNERIPYNVPMLSKIIRHNPDVVEKAIAIFKELGLIDILDNGAIYMLDIQNFIGKSSTEADRQRNYYNKIKDEKEKCKISYKKPNMISTPELYIEKDIDIEKDIELDIDINKRENILKEKKEQEELKKKEKIDERNKIIDNIIIYLNKKTNSRFNINTKSYRESINARLNEKYIYDDFIKVIDKKCDEWLKTDYAKFLTPDTLFSPSHFDKYLNEIPKVKKMKDVMEKVENYEEILK